ncbi:hypothetical protein DK853_54140, partial [Klebsiella oxytoca]
VMAVVGGHHGDAGLLAQADDPRVDHLLLGDFVVLDFQIIPILPKQLPHFQGVGLCPLVVPVPQPPGNLP